MADGPKDSDDLIFRGPIKTSDTDPDVDDPAMD